MYSPDWSFGLLKQRVRREKINCLEELARAVDESSDANIAEMVGTLDGTPLVTMYDWTNSLVPYFKRINQIKSYHHFTITSDNLKGVILKEYYDSEPELSQC